MNNDVPEFCVECLCRICKTRGCEVCQGIKRCDLSVRGCVAFSGEKREEKRVLQ